SGYSAPPKLWVNTETKELETTVCDVVLDHTDDSPFHHRHEASRLRDERGPAHNRRTRWSVHLAKISCGEPLDFRHMSFVFRPDVSHLQYRHHRESATFALPTLCNQQVVDSSPTAGSSSLRSLRTCTTVAPSRRRTVAPSHRRA